MSVASYDSTDSGAGCRSHTAVGSWVLCCSLSCVQRILQSALCLCTKGIPLPPAHVYSCTRLHCTHTYAYSCAPDRPTRTCAARLQRFTHSAAAGSSGLDPSETMRNPDLPSLTPQCPWRGQAQAGRPSRPAPLAARARARPLGSEARRMPEDVGGLCCRRHTAARNT